MRFACLITKATNTHSEYVILIAFPRQHSLLERCYIARTFLTVSSNSFLCIVGTLYSPVWVISPKVSAIFIKGILIICGSGSSVGIATLLAGRSGINSRWGRDLPPVQTGPGANPAACKMGTGPFPGVKCGRGVLLTTHPLLVPRSWKSRATPLPILWATPGT